MRTATKTKTTTILNGASLSGEVDLEGFDLMDIKFPAGWTAAGLAFKAAEKTGGTFDPVCDEAGAEVPVAGAGASKQIGLSGAARERVMANQFIKLVSGTNAAPVNQLADRIITLVLKRSGGNR